MTETGDVEFYDAVEYPDEKVMALIEKAAMVDVLDRSEIVVRKLPHLGEDDVLINLEECLAGDEESWLVEPSAHSDGDLTSWLRKDVTKLDSKQKRALAVKLEKLLKNRSETKRRSRELEKTVIPEEPDKRLSVSPAAIDTKLSPEKDIRKCPDYDTRRFGHLSPVRSQVPSSVPATLPLSPLSLVNDDKRSNGSRSPSNNGLGLKNNSCDRNAGRTTTGPPVIASKPLSPMSGNSPKPSPRSCSIDLHSQPHTDMQDLKRIAHQQEEDLKRALKNLDETGSLARRRRSSEFSHCSSPGGINDKPLHQKFSLLGGSTGVPSNHYPMEFARPFSPDSQLAPTHPTDPQLPLKRNELTVRSHSTGTAGAAPGGSMLTRPKPSKLLHPVARACMDQHDTGLNRQRVSGLPVPKDCSKPLRGPLSRRFFDDEGLRKSLPNLANSHPSDFMLSCPTGTSGKGAVSEKGSYGDLHGAISPADSVQGLRHDSRRHISGAGSRLPVPAGSQSSGIPRPTSRLPKPPTPPKAKNLMSRSTIASRPTGDGMEPSRTSPLLPPPSAWSENCY